MNMGQSLALLELRPTLTISDKGVHARKKSKYCYGSGGVCIAIPEYKRREIKWRYD